MQRNLIVVNRCSLKAGPGVSIVCAKRKDIVYKICLLLANSRIETDKVAHLTLQFDKSPLDIAASNGRADIVQLLQLSQVFIILKLKSMKVK